LNGEAQLERLLQLEERTVVEPAVLGHTCLQLYPASEDQFTEMAPNSYLTDFLDFLLFEILQSRNKMFENISAVREVYYVGGLGGSSSNM